MPTIPMALSSSMKKPLVIAWLLVLFASIALIFWRYEWKYSQPTPVPTGYHDIGRGTSVQLPASAAACLHPNGKPLFLHFFNPDCPCSRFNMPQFKALVQTYGSRVSFAIVIMS